MQKIIRFLKEKKKIAVVCALAVILLGTATGILVTERLKAKETAKVKTEVEEKEPEIEEVEVPVFSVCSIEGTSLEKDLTLYIKGADGQKIAGEPFEIKLISEEKCAELEETLNQLNENEQLIIQAQQEETAQPLEQVEETETGDEPEGASGAAADEEDGKIQISKESGQQLTTLELLNLQKKELLTAYTQQLETIEGTSYRDDDSDGMIYVDEINAGDYVACFVPGQDMKYYAADYVVPVTVKDKVEYKVVKNIKDKTVSASEAGDVQGSKKDVPVEKQPENTTTEVESSVETRPPEFGQVSAPVIAASASAEINQMAEGDASLSVNKTAHLYSGLAGKDSTVLQVNSSNVTGITVSSSDAGLSASLNGNSIEIKAGLLQQEKNIRVTVSGKTVSGKDMQVTCDVLVTGTETKLKDAQGKQLYLDAEGKQEATYGTYNEGRPYFAMTKEAVTIYYGWQNIDGNRYYFDANGNKVTGTQVIGGATYHFGPDGVLLTGGFGIDVSKWQGDIDWKQASSAVSFAIIRCGFRGSSGNIAVDPKFAQNIQGAKNNGVKVGVYFYSIAMNEAQAVEEASLAVELVKQYGGVSLPIYIDIEDSRQLSLSKAERDAIVNAFCTTVKNSGYSAGVYANKNWLTNYLTPSKYQGISVWVAQYNTQCTYNGKYDIWQYSNKGKIPGIKGDVDLNWSYF